MGMRRQPVVWGLVSLLGTPGSLWAADTQAESAKLAMTVPANGNAAQAVPTDLSEPMKVSMDFQDANVKDVLKIFSKQTGVNVIAREDIGDRTVTLYLEDVSILDALDQILNAADLTYERPKGSEIFIVKPKPGRSELGTETRVYRLKFARLSTSRLARAVEALGSQTPFEAQQLTAMGLSQGNTGGGSVTRPITATGPAKEIGIDRIVKELLSDRGKMMVDERTNSLIITELPENFTRIEAVLNALDIKTAQILIEAEVLETAMQNVKDLGVEWGADTSGSVLNYQPAKRTTRWPFSIAGDKTGTAPSVTLGTLDASKMNATLQMLERDVNTKVLARPKVLTLENESAVIRLTSQQAVSVKTSTLVTGTAVTETAPERMTTGIVLVVTPEVNDNGYITMLVEPSVTKTVPSEIRTDIVDPKTRSARALVRVRQGHTLVLGGLIDRSENETLKQVPLLSGIPFLGRAFQDHEHNNVATELIVFVTPKILTETMGNKVDWQHGAEHQQPSLSIREQEPVPSRQEMIEDTMNRLDDTTQRGNDTNGE